MWDTIGFQSHPLRGFVDTDAEVGIFIFKPELHENADLNADHSYRSNLSGNQTQKNVLQAVK